MDNYLTEKLNIFLDEVMELNDLPGLAIGVSIGLDTASTMSSDRAFTYTGVRGWRDYTMRNSDNGSLSAGSEINIPGDSAPALLEADDIFHCASVSKLFTSSAIMKLVEAGVLGLYDRLCNLLPELKCPEVSASSLPTGACIADWRFDEIRLWNMLTHTSGLGDCADYQWAEAETDVDSLSRYVYHSYDCIGQPMLWCPQTNPEFYGVPETDENGNPLIDKNGKEKSLFRYSNIAYEILGQIVSEYSHLMPDADGTMSYEDFVARYLLIPAGMKCSTMKTFERPGWSSEVSRMQKQIDPRNQSPQNDFHMALPHEKTDDRSIKLTDTYPYTRKHAPSSTLTSNLEDLLKWGRAHMKSATGQKELLLHKETYDSIWREYATVPNNGEKMGLGWFMRSQSGHTLMGHEGTDDGFRASFWMCPKLEVVTVALSNLSEAPVKRINMKLFETVISSQ